MTSSLSSTPTAVLIRGDGIGPEVVDATVQAVEAAGGKIKWVEAIAGEKALDQHGTALPKETLAAFEAHGLALKGPLATPIAGGHVSVNVSLRRTFDLYANLRPVRSFPGVPSRYEGIDLVIVRENTEGMYAGIEQRLSSDGEVARTVSQVTRSASERIARFAFDYARTHGRKEVCVVHKANILKLTSGLFLETTRAVARAYPDIACRELIVDNTCMQLVRDPQRFDVIVTTNLFGDILSDLCAGLVGGLGLTPAANIGERGALFEAVHGTAPDIAGKGLANPAATMLAAAMLLDHVGQRQAAQRLQQAVEAALLVSSTRTPDIGGSGSTQSFTASVLQHAKG